MRFFFYLFIIRLYVPQVKIFFQRLCDFPPRRFWSLATFLVVMRKISSFDSLNHFLHLQPALIAKDNIDALSALRTHDPPTRGNLPDLLQLPCFDLGKGMVPHRSGAGLNISKKMTTKGASTFPY